VAKSNSLPLLIESPPSEGQGEILEEPSAYFLLRGKPFCFQGANSYGLAHQSRKTVLDLLEDARSLNLKVLRTWSFLDRGSLDNTFPSIHGQGHKNGVYFQYWHALKNEPAYNDAKNGLKHLDFLLHHARRLGLKLILVLTNNWRDMGGMDQYLSWYGLQTHSQFYTDNRVKSAYKNWLRHLLTRVNSLDGVPYSEDPAIFAWELANEPRLTNGSESNSQKGVDMQLITSWAREMSAYVKSLDTNHLLSVGDEGFFDRKGSDWTFQGEGGVDHDALLALPHIDFGTFHLYPEKWKKDDEWASRWIEEHLLTARRLGKPTLLEEYGRRVERRALAPGEQLPGVISGGFSLRRNSYTLWNGQMMSRGGAGALFWTLAGRSRGRALADFDGYSVYRGDKSASLLSDIAQEFSLDAQACSLKNIASFAAKGTNTAAVSQFVTTSGRSNTFERSMTHDN